ncbi:MAG: mercuric reductase [Gemmatimonadota bacterium]|nr:mercuric reductase [Gemmatimonadota bacterium]
MKPATFPVDGHDHRLLAQVHPPTWRNPEPARRYHLVVIGAGTAGLVAAAGAAGLGARVALIERHLMGGDCLNSGCVPSKALLSAARAWQGARQAAREFAGPEVVGEGDFGAVMERLRRLRARLSPVDGAERFQRLGVDVFFGAARFTGPKTVEVGGASLAFRRAVIATGARATVPPIPGLAEAEPLTNETAFDLIELPPRLLVIGGGPIGCELAQAFSRFGSEVTVVDQADRLLPQDDIDAAAMIEQALRASGVRLEFGVQVTGVERPGPEVTARLDRSGSLLEVTADAVLVATGRTPNVEGLGLEAAGVHHDRGGVAVDDRLRTSNRSIYAAGDICTPLRFTHHADFQARLVLANALFFGRGKASRMVVPWCTYTSPEVAQVGMTTAEATRRGLQHDVITVPWSEVDRAVLDSQPEGFLRIVLAQGSDRILGVTIVAEHAGEMIGEAAVALTNRLGLGAIGRTMHPYPTQAEAFRKAADQWRRTKLTPVARRALNAWFRVFR